MAATPLFSQRFGYAIHTLCYLARKPPAAVVAAHELAQWMQSFWPDTSETYLVQVIQRLVRGGLLRSHRGKAGGYSLGLDPEKITLRRVVTDVEGVSEPQCSLAPGGACPVHVGCGILHRLRRVEDAYLNLLEEINVAELSEGLGVDVPDANAPNLLPVL